MVRYAHADAALNEDGAQARIKGIGHGRVHGFMWPEGLVKSHVALLGEVDELIDDDEAPPPDFLTQGAGGRGRENVRAAGILERLYVGPVVDAARRDGMRPPVPRKNRHGHAREVAFAQGRRGSAPLRICDGIPRVGENVQIVQPAAADDAYFHTCSFSLRVRMRSRAEATASA